MEIKNQGKTSLGMEANLAALLSYLVFFITGFVFYILEKENKFVRFNAMQSILVFGFLFVLHIVLSLLPVIGWILSLLIAILTVILWIVLMIKSYEGEYFKLPVVGDIAEKNS